MRTQTSRRSTPGTPKVRDAKLLFLGSDDEFKGEGMRGTLHENRPCIVTRSATLLGALERLHSEAVDIALLSHKFRDEELALFAADARRRGFEGLILRLPSLGASESAGKSPATGFPGTKGLGNDPLYPARLATGVRQQAERAPDSISITERQRVVLARVCEGWTSQQVARHLKCTEGAVKGVLQELFRKLGARNRAQIVRMAFETGLIDVDRKAAERPERVLSRSLASATDLEAKEPVHVGDFIIDVVMHQVWVRGVETHLTPTEFELLWFFAMHAGKLVKSSTIRERFWRNPTAREASLRVLVGALRAKIEVSDTPQYLITERSLGYRFNPSP
jgi:DNA-binding CsgD family transcriptional regulator/DNA-binding winged helix-turn-helix (wHTH) protein